ncbi:Sushi, von Willebrand factor type A, EGF and pentraxin domain-containing protein 1 [Nymphon striatum]|nr:Sushi, von Willebrand factor type A, EGF and pentraxin domain-containing protein 1 [Nymphon striatum]
MKKVLGQVLVKKALPPLHRYALRLQAKVLNVATGKAPMHTSTMNAGNNTPATIVLRVGKNRPDMKENPICNKFEGYIEENHTLCTLNNSLHYSNKSWLEGPGEDVKWGSRVKESHTLCTLKNTLHYSNKEQGDPDEVEHLRGTPILYCSPKTCGKPEQPTNSTLLARNYNVGTSVEYRCAPGHLLVGPQSRTCMADGFYSEYPPKCKYLECPIPFPVTNGEYRLLNGTMTYKSVVQYTCAEGYLLRGRKTLTCDVNQKWNGPPPRCERNCILQKTSEFETWHFQTFQELNDCRNLRRNTEVPTTTTTTPRPTTRRPIRLPTIPTYRRKLPVRKPPTRRPPFPKANIPEVIITTKRPISRPTVKRPYPRPLPSRQPEIPYVTKRTRKPIAPELPDLQSEGSKEVPIVTRYPSEVDNEIPNDVRGGFSSGTNLPENSVGEVSSRSKKTTKLNLGGIIALGVFGGFVFLAAIITIIVILVRRSVIFKSLKKI